MKTLPGLICIVLLFSACSDKKDFDASGNFESDEVIVSAQQNGQLLSFNVEEGQRLQAGEKAGQIDVATLQLQQQQAQASIKALRQQTSSSNNQTELVKRQLAVQQAQLAQLLHEQKRTENLVAADAATQKQLDDINAQINQLQKQMDVTRQQITLNSSNVATQNRGILSQQAPLEKSVEQYGEQIRKGEIINPVSGLVLTKYALAGETEVVGKPLYKISNTDTLTLRAYVTGSQLPQIKIGQALQVRIDQGEKNYKYYNGQITWISDKSEFTPKTIQTKDERANLVYAIKIRVKNDGYLKIGMYGEAIWNKQ